MRRNRRFAIILGPVMLTLAILACNLTSPADSGRSPTATSPAVADDGSRPIIQIESPASGTQGLLNQQFSVRIRATDSAGISRVMMREVTRDSARVVVMQPSPDTTQNFEALLPYTPTNLGNVTLEVVAYRANNTASNPASITIEIVASVKDLRNPGSLDPTVGVAAGNAVCTARVNIDNLNMRAGPGTNYRRITQLTLGETLSITGRDTASTWFQVKRQNNQDGWVSAQYVQQNGDCSRAPVVNPPQP